MIRFAVLLTALAAALPLAAGVPLQDRRNTDIQHTDTRYQAKRFSSLAEWQTRAGQLRKQVLSAAGLMPMPERTPLNAQIFGRIENKDYSVEKVYIETLPGFYLAGNLYRPLGRKGKFPGVLAPHGHAQYGRLEHGPLFSVPARGTNMARQGYVVFGYDMIGYNDTVQIPHVATGQREQLWSLGLLGLQTWNSIRALDFLQSLPDVDPENVGVTGESGGGTQTFMLCAVDDRPRISSPVNMISLIMQGGSPCENAPNLRVGANNVEIASLMAPRPMLMVSATGDWTKNTPKEEYPAVKAIYDLYGKGDQVETVQFDAPHNYNKDSREAVYKFFAKRVLNDPQWAQYGERSIRQEKLQDLMAFHGRALPANALTYDQLVERWIAAAKKQNAGTGGREALRERLAVSIGAVWPEKVEFEIAGDRIAMTRPGEGDRVPGIWLPRSKTAATLIVHPEGAEAARKAVAEGERSVLAIDAFQTGGAVAPRDSSARHFLTFNRTEDANRVQDILTALAFLKQQGATDVRLAGIGKAAVWATFAAALTATPLKLEAPLGDFRGADDDFIRDFFVPGIQRAGGLDAARLLNGDSNK
jgi:dienelactone hydrolase